MTSPVLPIRAPLEACLEGGGEMGALMRDFDWSTTPIGPVASWSPALRMMIRFLLANRFPLLLWWGPDYVSLYNDPYRPILGAKHPWALGQPVRACWSEIWHILQPLIDAPFHGGPPTWNEDIFLEINRHGFVEETHFTIAYSPVPDETVASGIGGVLATVHEITEQVVSKRRVIALRDLGAHMGEAKTAEEACAIAARTLSAHDKDIPFVLLYLIDADGDHARLAGAAGVAMGGDVAPLRIDLRSTQPDRWPFAAAVARGGIRVVEHLDEQYASMPCGPWSDPPNTAIVASIPSNKAHQPVGVMVAGISARLALDEYYRDFLDLVRRQVAMAIATARAYEEERLRAEALAEIDRVKTRFFSNVSHEFRTPLTLMIGPLEELLMHRDGALSRATERELEVVYRNSLRLLKLVNTLLDFSRLEADRVSATYEPTALAAYTAELASTFRSACERAGLMLTIDCVELPEPVYVDRGMWEKIVLNLASNAFKYTLAGEIRIALHTSGGAAQLVVADTGTGIPAESIPRLFERFYRVPNAGGRTHEGTGIGLALVHELVRLHGGHVSVDSAMGRGSTFTVTIPLGKDHRRTNSVAVSRAQTSTAMSAAPYIAEALRWLPGVAEPIEPPRTAAIPRVDPDGALSSAGDGAAVPRLLVADDNADMRDYVRRLLAERYDVEAVADGEQAIAAARAHAPDLLLLDVMMPRLDGFGVLRQLRDDPSTAAIPIILLSARAGEESRVEGLEAGADDYLIKPFSSRELLARVGAHLELARLRNAIVGREAAALTAIAASEAQRRSISRELHDELGQELTALVLGLKSVGQALEDSSIRGRVERLQMVAAQVSRDMHRIALELRPGSLDDQGLQTALSNYVEEWSKRTDIAVDFQIVGLTTERLAPHIETTIYRIVQEALSNVIRHANATAVSVVLQRISREVITIIEDDGHGFDAKAAVGSGRIGRIGLLGMQERAALVGGTCVVESHSGGTSIFVKIPLASRTAGRHRA